MCVPGPRCIDLIDQCNSFHPKEALVNKDSVLQLVKSGDEVTPIAGALPKAVYVQSGPASLLYSGIWLARADLGLQVLG